LETDKNKTLFNILDKFEFNQVIIFVQTITMVKSVNNALRSVNFPSVCIHSEMRLEEKFDTFKNFREMKIRILVTTDSLSRGINIEKLNIVINYDIPETTDSYIHRVGRVGRWNSKGLVISFASNENDMDNLNQVQTRFKIEIKPLPENVEQKEYMYC